MSLFNGAVLFKNERLKMYKKSSTWVLMCIILLLVALMVIFSNLSQYSMKVYQEEWQEQYKRLLADAKNQLGTNPEDPYNNKMSDTLSYLLEHDINPYDWRTDAVDDYFSLKHNIYGQNSYGIRKPGEIIDQDFNDFYLEKPAEADIDPARLQERMDKLWAIITKNDWKSYIGMKIDDLKSDYGQSENKGERDVEIEIYELYLEKNIVPISEVTHYYSGFDQPELMWKSKQIQLIRESKLNLLQGEDQSGAMYTRTQLKNFENDIKIAQERLSTNSPPVTSDSFLGMLEQSDSSLGLITILMVVYSANLFASEYGSGTIKMLLITPHKRNKIFRAKLGLLLEMSLISMGIVFIISFIINAAFTGFKGIGAMQILYVFGNMIRLPYLLYIFVRYLILMLPVIAYSSLALVLSVITRKSAVSITVTLLLLFTSDLFVMLMTLPNGGTAVPGAKFLIFANTSLQYYLPSAQSAYGGMYYFTVDETMTLGFSVTVLLVHIICFLWTAHDDFCRRDVK
ncbi:MAG: ABC transporter permease [Oscillospiraceae bacterium]|nr:ABC transporter permease [Oscillospiraceae bacterium]MDD4413907.1 ABC transporter permease [Oscillospiraceae bacterium]